MELITGLILLWFLLSIAGLAILRNRRLDEVAKAIWALVIVAIPLLGAIAIWVVWPGRAIQSAPDVQDGPR